MSAGPAWLRAPSSGTVLRGALAPGLLLSLGLSLAWMADRDASPPPPPLEALRASLIAYAHEVGKPEAPLPAEAMPPLPTVDSSLPEVSRIQTELRAAALELRTLRKVTEPERSTRLARVRDRLHALDIPEEGSHAR